jgi:Uma2 family endonuclease
MAMPATAVVGTEDLVRTSAEAALEQGDRLSRDEFEWRYEQMPHLKKAELIEGIVYLTHTVRAQGHGIPHCDVTGWIGLYAAETPGAECANNATVRLDLDNEPQPDLVLFKLPEKGGQARISADDYIEGAPELVVEIVGSSRAYDLHQKKGAYRRNEVREYVAWITGEQRLVWWELRNGDYEEIQPQADGFLKSGVFPGLWLNAPALLSGDKKALLAALRLGLDSAEHGAFLRADVRS